MSARLCLLTFLLCVGIPFPFTSTIARQGENTGSDVDHALSAQLDGSGQLSKLDSPKEVL